MILNKIAISGFVISLALYSCDREYDHQGYVHVIQNDSGYQLIRNGEPYFIKGAAGESHFAALANAGGNTIRTWNTEDLQLFLDSAHLNGLAVMAGLPVVKSGHTGFYDDPQQVKAQYEKFREVVLAHKDHPALLIWVLGNELEFRASPRYNRFYDAYNELLKMVHHEDPDHPVTTTIVNFPEKNILNLRLRVPELDIISINIFGEMTYLKEKLENIHWLWDGPFIITEWGLDGPWESETTAWGAPFEPNDFHKAWRLINLYHDHLPLDNPRLLGTTFFYWGNKFEQTPTWFSTFTEDGIPMENFHVVKSLWNDKNRAVTDDFINEITVNGKSSQENIVLKPGDSLKADIMFNRSADSLKVKWQIYKEDWYYKADPVFRDAFNQKALLDKMGTVSLSLVAPEREGPYRIFAYAWRGERWLSSSNTPFYVLGNGR